MVCFFRLLIDTSFLPQPSLEAGFDFHFCGDGDTLILKQWLPDSPSRLPLGPTHQVGVGALILNDEGKMLVVQEKSGPAAGTNVMMMCFNTLDQTTAAMSHNLSPHC